jgi:hypothetical protein
MTASKRCSALVLGAALACFGPTFSIAAAQLAQSQATPQQGRSTATVEGSFRTEAEAQRRCPGTAVVWVNTRSRIYHAKGTRDYGKTRSGFYMCQSEANNAGYRPVRGSTPKKGKGVEKS